MNYFSSEFTEENKFGSHRIKVTGVNRVIYRVSNVYLSCIYRICNVVNSGRVAGE